MYNRRSYQPISRSAVLAVFVLFAGNAVAQDRAIVVGVGAYPGQDILARPVNDALTMGDVLRRAGYDVTVQEDATAIDPPLTSEANAVFYFSGLLRDVGGQSYLVPADIDPTDDIAVVADAWPLNAMILAMAEETRDTSVMLLDICHSGSDTVVLDSIPENVLVALPNMPGDPCAADTNLSFLANGIRPEGLIATLDAAPDGAVWLSSVAGAPVLNANDLALLDALPAGERARTLALYEDAGLVSDDGHGGFDVAIVETETIVLTGVQAPLAQRGTLGALGAPRPGAIRRVDDGIALRAARPVSAVPATNGLPEPSIIVGEIRNPTAFDVAQEDANRTLSGNEVDLTTVAARRALREDDPELFATLLDSGALDPTGGELPRTMQEELAAMGCYLSGIDGVWGNGSRGAVSRYYLQVGTAPLSLEPTVPLFRVIAGSDAVTCPAPVAAAPAAPRTSAPRTSNTRTAPSAPRTTTIRQPTPTAPAPQRQINTTAGGTGIFR